MINLLLAPTAKQRKAEAKADEIEMLVTTIGPLRRFITFYRSPGRGAVTPENATLITQAHALLATAQYRHDTLRHPRRRRL